MQSPAQRLNIFGSHTRYWKYHDSKLPIIVVLHGFRGTHHGLLDIIEQLPGYHIVVPDLPGFGESTPMTQQPHTVAGYAQFILEFLKQLHLGPVILLGHSMGTQIAAEAASLDPAIATHLLLINPIAEHPMHGLGALRMAPGIWYHWIGGKFLPPKLGQMLLKSKLMFYIGSVSMTKTRDKALRKRIHHNHMTYMSHYHDRGTLLEAYYSSIENTVTMHAAQIKIPTLLVAGKNDAIAPIAGQRMLVGLLAKGKLVELDNVGHIIHYEQPTQAARAILDFLNPTKTTD